MNPLLKHLLARAILTVAATIALGSMAALGAAAWRYHPETVCLLYLCVLGCFAGIAVGIVVEKAVKWALKNL